MEDVTHSIKALPHATLHPEQLSVNTTKSVQFEHKALAPIGNTVTRRQSGSTCQV